MTRKDLIVELTRVQLAELAARTPKSLELCQRRGVQVMPLGAPTNVCSLYPHPIAIASAAGAHLRDIDGNSYCDFGLGYGTLPFGHAHPAILDAVAAQAARGTHYGAVTPVVVDYAEHLCERFGLDWVRFSASGTEATMDAVRIARAKTGRAMMVKCEGAYHGSHPDALLSINQDLDERMGPDDDPRPWPVDKSLAPNAADNVRVVAFNDLAAVDRALSGRDVACLIVEPVMFNVGAVEPGGSPDREAGALYLQGLRDLCDEYGTLLVFDEVKTGATVAWGGAEDVWGVRPHLKTFAKTVCGGLPGGALGDTDGSCFELVESWDVMHVGTLSGNPMTAAAGLAALTEVMTPDAYRGIDAFGARLAAGVEAVIAEHRLPAYLQRLGAKSCLVWAPERLRDFRHYSRTFDSDMAFLCWAWMTNHGVWFSHGSDEQMTFSVAHTDADADGFIRAFEGFGAFVAEHGLAV